MIEVIQKYAGSTIMFLWGLIIGISFLDYDIHPVLWWSAGLSTLGVFTSYVVAKGIAKYVLKRIGEAIVTLVVIATFTFLLLRVLPGGPFDSEKALPPEVIANIEAKYNLDAPLYEQYFDYMFGVLQGDFGQSYKYIGRNVSEIISESLPVSFQLGVYAMIVAFLIGVPAGLLAASKHNTLADAAIMFIAISGVSLPSFLVAPLLIILFCFTFDLFPPAFWDGPEYYILPVITLGTRPAAVIARLTRASVLEVIRSDYIRTAKAKGLAHKVVLFRHVLKNSLIPVLTFSGPLAAGVLTGSLVIEIIFAIPGMGKHIVQSVTNRDYPLVLGLTLVFSALLVLANLIVDLLYSYFDPRIKLS